MSWAQAGQERQGQYSRQREQHGPGLGRSEKMLKEIPLVWGAEVGEKRHGRYWLLNLLVRRAKRRDGVGVKFLEGVMILKVPSSGHVDGEGENRAGRIVLSRCESTETSP